jgi:hypothetical protein
MRKFGRIVVVGLAGGLVVFLWGTASHLVLSPFAVGSNVFREADLARVLWSFGLNLVLGFFYVAAYALVNGGHERGMGRRLLNFFGLLFLMGVAPRALISYRYFELPARAVAGWTISWTVEALLVALIVALWWPRPKIGPACETAG